MEIGKNNVGENKYFMTTNNVIKTIDTHENNYGVTFDSKLAFVKFISQVVNKATKLRIIIRRTFQFLDKQTILPPLDPT